MAVETPLSMLRDGKLPKMVRWYDPRLLFRVFVRTLVSNVFGQYADQRIVQSATDPGDAAEVLSRYDYSNIHATDPLKRPQLDPSGALWDEAGLLLVAYGFVRYNGFGFAEYAESPTGPLCAFHHRDVGALRLLRDARHPEAVHGKGAAF